VITTVLKSGCYDDGFRPSYAESKANNTIKLASYAGGRHIKPHPGNLTFDLLILKVVSESHVTWATSVQLLVFLGLSVLLFST